MKYLEIKENFDRDKNYKVSLKVKEYITLNDKIQYKNDVLDSSIEYKENGICLIDYISKQITCDLLMLTYYTNLELDEDIPITEQYEFLLSKGIIKSIKSKLIKKDSDFSDLLNIIELYLMQELKITNSFESLVANGIQKLLNKIPEEEKMLNYLKDIKNFDPNKLGMIKNLFNFSTENK